MMKPRGKDPMADARFLELLEENVLPTTTSVELVRTPQTDYRLRFGAMQPHVAELFHENTKLTPHRASEGESGELTAARRRHLEVPYRVREEDLNPAQADLLRVRHCALGDPLALLLAPFAEQGPDSELLYSVDVMLAHRGMLLRQIAGADFLWVEKHLSRDELTLIRASTLGAPPSSGDEPILFLAGAPWRYMMFLGPRGYRHMLLDVGRVVERLHGVAARARLELGVHFDFYDARVDRALLLDGVERSTLAVLFPRFLDDGASS